MMTVYHGFNKHHSKSDTIIFGLICRFKTLKTLKQFILLCPRNSIALISDAANNNSVGELSFYRQFTGIVVSRGLYLTALEIRLVNTRVTSERSMRAGYSSSGIDVLMRIFLLLANVHISSVASMSTFWKSTSSKR